MICLTQENKKITTNKLLTRTNFQFFLNQAPRPSFKKLIISTPSLLRGLHTMISTSILRCLTLNMSALKLQTFRQNSLRSTTFKVAIVMVGSTLRFARAVMASPRPAFSPTISSDPALLLKDITRPNLPQPLAPQMASHPILSHC